MDDIRFMNEVQGIYDICGQSFTFSIEKYTEDGDEFAVFTNNDYSIVATPENGHILVSISDAPIVTVYDYRKVNDEIEGVEGLDTFSKYMFVVEEAVADMLWMRIAKPFKLFKDG